MTQPLSNAEREQCLDDALIRVVHHGGRIESRSPTQAVVVTGQPQSGGVHVIHFLLTLITCGLWAFVWALYAMSRHEDRIVLTVDHWGNIVCHD